MDSITFLARQQSGHHSVVYILICGLFAFALWFIVSRFLYYIEFIYQQATATLYLIFAENSVLIATKSIAQPEGETKMTVHMKVPSRATLTQGDFRGVARETVDLVAALEHDIQGEVRFDGYSRMLYSTDASLYQIQPIGVVIPRHTEDMIAALEIAARFGVPVLPRGGGSSLAGQAVGPALVIDTSKYMDRIIGVDEEARTVKVQPGMTVGTLNRTLAPLKLMLGPDPASAERATIGGSVGNNATGSHSILYGMMADNVIETGVILVDGSTARFGPVAPADLAALGRGDSLAAQIYREIPELVRGATPKILERWPRHWRRASGYNLDRLAAPLLPASQRGGLSFDSRFRPAVADPVRLGPL